jgi:suppressor of cytokine signaling 6/7
VAVTVEKTTVVFMPPTVVCTNDSTNSLKLTSLDVPMSTSHLSPIYPRKLKVESLYERRQCLNHRFASPRLLHLSPCRLNRPSSRNSLSSRLSSSHNSLVTQFQTDDSSFITQAISHDTLSAKTSDITDMYNVPFDSDIYAVPIDMIRPNRSNLRNKGKRMPRNNKKRGKSTPLNIGANYPLERNQKVKETRHKDVKTKRHSLPSSSVKKSDSDTDSLQLTLREMRKYLHTLYSSSSDSECRNTVNKKNNTVITSVGIHTRHCNRETTTSVLLKESNELSKAIETNNNHKKSSKNSFGMNAKNKKHKENIPKDIIEVDNNDKSVKKSNHSQKTKMNPVRILSINLKQSFCNLFRWRRQPVVDNTAEVERVTENKESSPPPAVRRALPPLPQTPHTSRKTTTEDDPVMDFATSLQKVKDVSMKI